LVAKKLEMDKDLVEMRKVAAEAERTMKRLCSQIGNIVADACPVAQDEEKNLVIKTWHPDGPNAKPEARTDIIAHHEVMHRLDCFDLERGTSTRASRVVGPNLTFAFLPSGWAMC
jgi:seryl-tRNA synthetase